MLYLVNPNKPGRRTARKRPARRPTAKQVAARKKFAAMARARASAARKRKRAQQGATKMATRRRKTARRRRATTARRRSPARRRRGVPVYVVNPRKRTRRRASARRTVRWYSRNPVRVRGALNQVMDLAQASGVALVGAAAGRTVSNLIPLGSPTDPIMSFAKGAVAAIAIRTLGERFLGREMARFAAVGAMLGPTKDLIVAFVPQAETFLGRSDQVTYLPAMTHRGIAAYSNGGMDVYGDGAGAEETLAAYSNGMY